MTTFATSSLALNATAASITASYRDFVQKMTVGFESIGWVNTNAVGTINTSSFAISTVSGSSVGYQVWRFNDDLHNTNVAPVFVKVEYCNLGSTTVLGSGYYISVGSVHDGFGNVGFNSSSVGPTPRLAAGTTALQSGTLYPINLCAISGGSAVGVTAYSNASAGVFLVERSLDFNGNYTADYVSIAVFDAYNNRSRQTYFRYNRQDFSPRVETAISALTSTTTASAYANNVAINMAIPIVPDGYGYPSRMLGFVLSNDFALGATHQITMFATQSTFFVPNITSALTSILNRNTSALSACRVAIRYE